LRQTERDTRTERERERESERDRERVRERARERGRETEGERRRERERKREREIGKERAEHECDIDICIHKAENNSKVTKTRSHTPQQRACDNRTQDCAPPTHCRQPADKGIIGLVVRKVSKRNPTRTRKKAEATIRKTRGAEKLDSVNFINKSKRRGNKQE